MTPFQVYSEYLALQQHFTLDRYDYFRYNAKTRASESSFNKRNDRYSFIKIARHPDPKGLLLANLVDNPQAYVGDIAGEKGNDIYLDWLRRKEALAYTFKSDLSRLNQESFLINLRVDNGKHPLLLRKFLSRQVTIESMVIIDAITGCFAKWNSNIDDPVVWPDVYKKCSKYSGFLQFDADKMFCIVTDRYC